MISFNSLHVILVCVFFSFFTLCLCSKKKNGLFWIVAVLFLIFAVSLRIMVPPEFGKDYIAYERFFGYEYIQINLSTLFIEPYRYLLYKVLRSFSENHLQTVQLVYYANLLINIAFFVWLACLRDIPLWRKMLLFSLYFIVFSLIWIRASVAYIIIGVALYYNYQNSKIRFIGILAPFVHLSSVSVIYFWCLRFVNKTYLKPVFIGFLFLAAYLFINSDYSGYLLYKVDYYVETGAIKDNLKHQGYFVVLSSLFIAYMYNNWSSSERELFLLLYGLYAFTHFVNVVAAQRISHYLIFAIMLAPVLGVKPSRRFVLAKTVGPVLFFAVYYFKFVSVTTIVS